MTHAELTSHYAPALPAVSPLQITVWSGRVLSAAVIAFMLFDAAIKLPPRYEVTETMAHLGFFATPELARGLAVLALLCAALYAWPRTAILGAILLTGYFGGAMAIHLRADSPLFSHLLFGFYLGVMTWGGLFLRDARVRAFLFPFFSK